MPQVKERYKVESYGEKELERVLNGLSRDGRKIHWVLPAYVGPPNEEGSARFVVVFEGREDD